MKEPIRYLFSIAAMAALTWTAATADEATQTTPDIAQYEALEAELADTIAQRRALSNTLLAEQRAVTEQARDAGRDIRNAMIDWRSERSAEIMHQNELHRQIHQTAGRMFRLLMDYNEIVRPEPDAPEVEQAEYRELENQIRFIITETMKHYERQTAIGEL